MIDFFDMIVALQAKMAELADALASGASEAIREGSSPFLRTIDF